MTDARALRGLRFPAEVILWAVRWYLQFLISDRDLERMLADRGVEVDHTTMYRGVQRFAPSSRSACAGTCGRAMGRGTSTRPSTTAGFQWRYGAASGIVVRVAGGGGASATRRARPRCRACGARRGARAGGAAPGR